MSKKLLYLVTAFLLVFGGFAAKIAVAEEGPSVEPIYYEGNLTCQDLGYDLGIKFDDDDDYPLVSGTYQIEDYGEITITLYSDEGEDEYRFVDWESTFGIDAVLVKGGPGGYEYPYSPEEHSDTGLHAPTNPDNGKYFGISHIDFCFDYYYLDVEKTAETTFTRTFDWTIEKSSDVDELVLSLGSTYPVDYTVSVSAEPTDEFYVEGTITIYNPDPDWPATIESIEDVISDFNGDVSLDCGEDFETPYILASEDYLYCTYSAVLPDGTERLNTATVTTSGEVGGGYGTAPIMFDDEPGFLVDDCVDVDDDPFGLIGSFCVEDDVLTHTFEYIGEVGPYEVCGPYEFENTATFTTNDTGSQGSDSHIILITVPCDGCTLTIGYWKTHSKYGPAPYDPTWAGEDFDEDTDFFLSGQTYYEVLMTNPSSGNAYYILAHQYIAAKLNIRNGAATTPEVLAAISWAEGSFFNLYLPTDVLPNTIRQQALAHATLLDNYNNGLIGPGHCTESTASLLGASLYYYTAAPQQAWLYLPFVGK
jgi:hypothetical protein